jgi:hypothetical protein
MAGRITASPVYLTASQALCGRVCTARFAADGVHKACPREGAAKAGMRRAVEHADFSLSCARAPRNSQSSAGRLFCGAGSDVVHDPGNTPFETLRVFWREAIPSSLARRGKRSAERSTGAQGTQRRPSPERPRARRHATYPERNCSRHVTTRLRRRPSLLTGTPLGAPLRHSRSGTYCLSAGPGCSRA